MKASKVRLLTDCWFEISQSEGSSININKVQKVAKDTCEILKPYAKKESVPKEIAYLIFIMNQFDSTAFNLRDSEYDSLYRHIVDIICLITEAFFTDDFENSEVYTYIETLCDKD